MLKVDDVLFSFATDQPRYLYKYSTEVHIRDNYSLPDSLIPRIVLKYVVVDDWTPWVGSPEASGKDQTTMNRSHVSLGFLASTAHTS